MYFLKIFFFLHHWIGVKEIAYCVQAKCMHWIVDQIPDQSLLNTAGWRFIVPQLYKKYPNHDMNLNISLSSPPVVEISTQKAGAHIFADMTIDVLEEDEVIPVACISLVRSIIFKLTGFIVTMMMDKTYTIIKLLGITLFWLSYNVSK